LERRDAVEVFVVLDKAFFGKGVFGVFSSADKAAAQVEVFGNAWGCTCEVKQFSLDGSLDPSGTLFAAFTHDSLYDTYVLDGVYTEVVAAHAATNRKGLVAELILDGLTGPVIRDAE
jgi:hypothetical protein